jgi:hypothetical protein
MIITKQMENAVHDKMPDVAAEWLTLFLRFAGHRLQGEHNVAEQKRMVRRGIPRWFPGPER